jgi:hypothetical protein
MDFDKNDIFTVINGHKVTYTDVISSLNDYMYCAILDSIDKSYYKNDKSLECYVYYPETYFEYVELKLNNIDQNIDLFKYIIIDQTRRVYLYHFINDVANKFNIDVAMARAEVTELINSIYPPVIQNVVESTVKTLKNIYECHCMVYGKLPKFTIMFKPLEERQLKKHKKLCNSIIVYKHRYKDIYWIFNDFFNKWHPVTDLNYYL